MYVHDEHLFSADFSVHPLPRTMGVRVQNKRSVSAVILFLIMPTGSWPWYKDNLCHLKKIKIKKSGSGS